MDRITSRVDFTEAEVVGQAPGKTALEQKARGGGAVGFRVGRGRDSVII